MKPIGIIWNDVHLKQSNEQQIIESVIHLIKYAVANQIKNIFLAGDLFDSRSFQRQSSLLAFDKILELFSKAGLTLYMFPGNHDKTVYESEVSFLEVYKHHPSVIFNSKTSKIDIEGISITLIPFFSDDVLVPMLNEAEGGDILISHFEMAGSCSNGVVSEKSAITRKMLRKWKKVYLGHYHDWHEITPDIVHLPSFRQNNFGEDSKKGFTVFYDDLSYELIQGHFREFLRIQIDVSTTDNKAIKVLITEHKNSEKNVRFEFIGDEEKLKAIDKGQFAKTGIDTKFKYTNEAKATSIESPKVTKKYGEQEISEQLKVFCKEKDLNFDVGKRFLNEFLIKT